MKFVFQPNPSRIVFGAGTLETLAEEAERLGIERALIISSPGRKVQVARARDLLGARCVGASDAGLANMPEASFDRAMGEIADARADGLVVIGGGSPIGLGKALGAATGLAQIAVPTTYSGSELMADWRIETADGGMRRGVDAKARPATVIFDPLLTLDLPPAISGPSGMNAAAHAVESLYAAGAGPVSLTMGEEGIRLLAESLPIVVRAPGEVEARTRALQGAWLAGGFRAGIGLEHRIAQRLRSRLGLPHAESHALTLPFVVAFNEVAAPDAMARIARALRGEDAGAAAGLFRLNDTLGIKASLAAMGVDEAALDAAADDIAGADIANPRPVTRDDVRRILHDMFHGHRPVGV
jgi:maleylacetate reductase